LLHPRNAFWQKNTIFGRCMVATCFDAGHQSSTIELSNINLTAEYTADYTGAGGVFGTTGYNTGTHQVTFTVVDVPAGANYQLGLANHTHDYDTSLEDGSSVCVTQSGQIYYGGDYSDGGNIGTLTADDTIVIALVDGQAWFQRNGGDWNGSSTASPSTGEGGIDLSYMLGSGACAFPAFWADTEDSEVTADFSAWDTTFDPGHISSTITLSNSNLTATYTADYTGAGGAFGTNGFGKRSPALPHRVSVGASRHQDGAN
jgi:hypothetical protein